MSTHPNTPIAEPPAGAGLPLGQRSTDDEHEPRSGDDLIDAAGSGAKLAPKEQQDLLDYFLTNQGLPGDDVPMPVEWTVGSGSTEVKNVWKVRTISWEAYQDSVDLATDKKTDERDVFVTASYVVARALVEPKLGPVVARLQQEDPRAAPSDAAQLLRRMFEKQSGVLLELSGAVLLASKLGVNGTGGVRMLDEEIAAGKG